MGVRTFELAVTPSDSFVAFAAADGERLRRVLVARYGVEVGNDVCADALAYAWEQWDRVEPMDNPVGYLYRVAQSASRRHRRWRQRVAFPAEPATSEVAATVDVGRALASLNPRQRECVVLVHVYDWTYDDVAAALDTTTASVRNHLHRGMTKLRDLMGADQ